MIQIAKSAGKPDDDFGASGTDSTKAELTLQRKLKLTVRDLLIKVHAPRGSNVIGR